MVSIGSIACRAENAAETAVVVFPVYCQNIPKPVKKFLSECSAKYVVLIATYGGISPGNVLWEASKCVFGAVIAAAAIPTGHSVLSESEPKTDFPFSFVAERIRTPKEAKIVKRFKNPFSDFFPSLRSRLGIKITRLSGCNRCKLCEENCPTHAIRDGAINGKCIRCLRCVSQCPKHALSIRVHPLLKMYLLKKRKNRLVLYL